MSGYSGSIQLLTVFQDLSSGSRGHTSPSLTLTRMVSKALAKAMLTGII